MASGRGPRGLTLLLLSLAASVLVGATPDRYAPNHYLGTCLTKEWVAETEAALNISATTRDGRRRLEHPHLHAALATPRFWLQDPRTVVSMDKLYGADCATKGNIYGIGATVDRSDGKLLSKGRVNGTLIAEYKNWASYQLTLLVFSILAQEVLGYEVALYQVPDSNLMGERLSRTKTGLCSPVHVNVEEWGNDYSAYANDIYKAGTHTYVGRSGVYTTIGFINNGTDPALYSPTFDADFWRDYTKNEQLIGALSVDDFKARAKYYPPSEVTCPDGTMGCQNSCSRTEACTIREGKGKKCMVVLLMYPYYDPGFVESIFANNGIPAYFCHIGYDGILSIAVEAHEKGFPVVFYHYEPDPFQIEHDGKFERIYFPRPTPEKLAVDNRLFGENGFGTKSSNRVAVDFPTAALFKYGSNVLNENNAIASFLSRMSVEEGHMKNLLKRYVNMTSGRDPSPITPNDLIFSSSCAWLRENYMTWRLWIDRLPECTLFTHIAFSVLHCDDGKPRQIVFEWKDPDPNDVTKPYKCDGGDFATLPRPLETSRTCAWIADNTLKWFSWIFELPQCDASFYEYRVSECAANSKRRVEYHWLLEDSSDPTHSRECSGGVALPNSLEIDCEYTPRSAPIFKVIVAIASILISALVFMIGFVYYYRLEPIIKRSQWEFLTVMIVGGILMCGATIVYAGEPTTFLCGARPAITSTAFTLIFGSLVVKSMRVYRVFLSGAMKRVVLSTFTMFKILGLFLMVDLIILLAWFIADFPSPTIENDSFVELGGGMVQVQRCHSASFIFTALLIFWKAIVLGMGIYLSFLIRNVSTDFQESIWIFVSSVVVLFGSILVLPMAYLIDLPAQIFYIFLSFALLGCTAMVMGMMLVPKIRRLHERSPTTTTTRDSNTQSGSANTQSGSNTSETEAREPARTTTTANKAPKASILRLPFRPPGGVQVTPVEEFRPEGGKGTRPVASEGES